MLAKRVTYLCSNFCKMNGHWRFFLLITVMSFGLRMTSQTVYISEWKSEADLVVYVSEWKSDADLVVYKTEWKSEAEDDSGIWYFTEWKSEADLIIFFTDWKSEADAVIYYTDWKSEAGWKKAKPKRKN